MGQSIMHAARFFGAGVAFSILSSNLNAAGSPAGVEEVVREFVSQHPSVSGQSFELRNLTLYGKTAGCSMPVEVSTSQPKLRSKINVRLRCAKPAWSASASAELVLPGDYWVTDRFLPAGTVVTAADLRPVTGDLAVLPEDVVRSEAEAVGRVVGRPLPAGSALRLNALRENAVIKSGERVRINLVGSGFSVSGAGVALTPGHAGGAVTVKTVDGQQFTGRVVKAGMVEVVLE